MTRVDETVTVWVSDDGVPQRIVWRARRYRVSDVPTCVRPGPQVTVANPTRPVVRE